MPHRPDTWTDALFRYPLYHVNFLTSFMEWFRFFVQWCDSENRELNFHLISFGMRDLFKEFVTHRIL